ncbi:serine/threonine protein kinase ppk15, putative [Entamoeba dispar SAW760]|uniref:Serine/threonine protein kinase ppk15, putative n=1 Tax=Entamoeba dispar (strain ATCC PRA-260 / SAW760) TaxID=370354 RepID=B0EL92_ENTDS|nr:serine/threonine protein kinase ppk15, putative [Entamoeba dispar SAW760]EDR24706.1 serine/threonine protein kinase ppk15, putative [Entamoeba dispar SAW760]|eukprot:EDR24706.1 serine/threonine protein kinase ppk15, putative [Entamoeba dispar SAW760]
MSHRRKNFIIFRQTSPFTVTNFTPYSTSDQMSIEDDELNDERFVLQSTVNMIDVLRKCNDKLDFTSFFSRPITSPSTPTGNMNRDNENNDLILSTEQLLGTGVDPTQTTGKLINSRYRVISLLGNGAFGQVVKAHDEQNNKEVAVKVLKNKASYMRQAMLEIAVLHLLNHHFDPDCKYHTLRMYDHFVFYNHVCIVTELLGMNLYELIKQKQYNGLNLRLTVNILKQLVESLDVLYKNNIAHCDLKPENILLVDNTSNIRLIDFGSSCFENSTLYTYIQSRHYRSPEVLLGIKYTTAIDMWSFGCIAAELILGIPIFPGSSEYNQLERIIKMIGMPPKNILDQGTKTRKFFKLEMNGWVFKSRDEYEMENNIHLEPNRQYHHYTDLENFTERLSKVIKNPQTLKLARKTYLDFLQRTLCWDPKFRLTPAQAMQHPFLMNKPLHPNYQPPHLPEPCRSYPGDSALSADDALKIVCPPSIMPSKFKYQTYTTQVYYQVFIAALEKGIVLNILNANPFALQPMTPPVLLWEEVENRKKRNEKQRERSKKRRPEHQTETYNGRQIIQQAQSMNGSSWKGGDGSYSSSFGRDMHKSFGQSWSKNHLMIMPQDK